MYLCLRCSRRWVCSHPRGRRRCVRVAGLCTPSRLGRSERRAGAARRLWSFLLGNQSVLWSDCLARVHSLLPFKPFKPQLPPSPPPPTVIAVTLRGLTSPAPPPPPPPPPMAAGCLPPRTKGTRLEMRLEMSAPPELPCGGTMATGMRTPCPGGRRGQEDAVTGRTPCPGGRRAQEDAVPGRTPCPE